MALELNQRIFTWLCIYPLNVNASYKSKLISIIFTGFSLTFMFFTIISSALYIIKHANPNFEGVLYATFQFFGAMSTVYMTITAYFLRPEIVKVFNMFCHIHAKSELLHLIWTILFNIIPIPYYFWIFSHLLIDVGTEFGYLLDNVTKQK